MTKKEFYLTLTLTVIAGFVGGLLSGWLLNAGIVRAHSEGVIPKVIRAEKFELVDEQGNILSILTHVKGKGGELFLFEGVTEKERSIGTLSSRELKLGQSQKSKVSPIRLVGDEKGISSLSLNTLNGVGTSLYAHKLMGGLVIKDEEQIRRLELAHGVTQTALSLKDKNGKRRILIGTATDEEPYLEMIDSESTSRVLMAVTEKKSSITFKDKYGKTQAGIGELEGKGMVIP